MKTDAFNQVFPVTQILRHPGAGRQTVIMFRHATQHRDVGVCDGLAVSRFHMKHPAMHPIDRYWMLLTLVTHMK